MVVFCQPHLLDHVHLVLELLPGGRSLDPPAQQTDPYGHQVGGQAAGAPEISKDVQGRVARLREKAPHGAVDQQGVKGTPEKGDYTNPEALMPGPFGGQIQEPHQQAKEHPGSHAEQKALHRMAAQEGGKELVGGHDVAG